MRKEKTVEFVLSAAEVRLILTKRRKRLRRLIRKRRRINKLIRFKRQITQNAALFRQRMGGMCLVLLGIVLTYVFRNEPDPGELIFSSVLMVVIGLGILLTKKNLVSCK